jgi:glycerophosphoryl diester phosphodiesterase
MALGEYVDAGIPPAKVWPESFLPADVFYWIENTEYGAEIGALDEFSVTEEQIDIFLDLLLANNVKIVAPPMQLMVEPAAPASVYLMQPTYYATAAKARGISIITWTLERAGPGWIDWMVLVN